MKRVLFVGAVIGLMSSVGQGGASVWFQVTTDNIEKLPYVLSVKTNEVGGVIEFVVTVNSKKGGLSRLREGSILVYNESTQIACCPIAESMNDWGLEYRFQVSSNYVDNSKFEFREIAFGTRKNSAGKERLIPLPGSNTYWFYLKDAAHFGVVPKPSNAD